VTDPIKVEQLTPAERAAAIKVAQLTSDILDNNQE
jgi:hypothetical protein